MEFPPPPQVAGLSLDGETPFIIDTAEDAALCRSTGIEPDTGGLAHPVWHYIATQIGMGKTVAGLCAACDFDVADGPMMGSSNVVFQSDIRVGVPYRVTGEIVSLVRKASKKLGMMDVLEYCLRLVEPGGTTVTETRSVWVLPRKSAAATEEGQVKV